MDSINFWNSLYSRGLGSGLGSEGVLKDFKINFLNDFIKANNISQVLDFGYGDSVIASQLELKEYVGIDISEKLKINKNKFLAKKVKLITCPFDIFKSKKQFELVNCIDVLYHILENEQTYLFTTLDKIFDYAEKFVIIYAQDSFESKLESSKTEYNSPWRQYVKNKTNFEQIFEQKEYMEGSGAKFYIFKRKSS